LVTALASRRSDVCRQLSWPTIGFFWPVWWPKSGRIELLEAVCRWLRCRSERGQSIVEFAMTAPILITFILGMVEAGNAYAAYLTLVDASREGARLAARGNIFQDPQVLLVVKTHSLGLDLSGAGTVRLIDMKFNPTLYGTGVYTCHQLVEGGPSTDCTSAEAAEPDVWRMDAAKLTTFHNRESATDSTYMGVEEMVVVKLIYDHHTITGFIQAVIPLRSYTVMPVSGPS
jgi:TadE-like protein